MAAVCDPDTRRLDLASQRNPDATLYRDVREAVTDDDLDAVVIASCNHWHCLAAILAMQSGKDVYVEKPLSHSQWEGRQAVAAADRYGRVCQIGTQQRSDPMQSQIKAFLHDQGGIGRITGVRVNRFGVRQPIGRRDTPLPIDDAVAYDLWLGPAADEPIYRSNLHYDWHWVWNTGSGEMGNWGVHVLDDVRNTVFRDRVELPSSVAGCGGRIGYDDAGETPNVHLAFFDTGDIPVTIALTNLPGEPGGRRPPSHPGPDSGYVVYGEDGELHGQRGRAEAFDGGGRSIRKFEGNGSVRHQANFLEAVRRGDASLLNAPVSVGNDSTGWCNLANLAVRGGGPIDAATLNEIDDPVWRAAVADMNAHLQTYDVSIDDDAIVGMPLTDYDATRHRFVGDGSEAMNRHLKRDYRDGFEVPALVG